MKKKSIFESDEKTLLQKSLRSLILAQNKLDRSHFIFCHKGSVQGVYSKLYYPGLNDTNRIISI